MKEFCVKCREIITPDKASVYDIKTKEMFCCAKCFWDKKELSKDD